MTTRSTPGRKPKRLYLRLFEVAGADPESLPSPPVIRQFLARLSQAGRLVGHGPLTDPPGDVLLYRAREGDEARRVLRTDPWAQVAGGRYEVLEWNPTDVGVGVNLDLPPARGSGHLTLLQRVAVVVSDQERAIEFYHTVLGFEIRVRDSESGYVELALGKGTAALNLVAPHPNWGEPYYSEAKARIGTRTGIVFQTDSVAALELRLRHFDARVTQPPASEPWGGRSLRFMDPDGNEFLAFEAAYPPSAPTGPPSKEQPVPSERPRALSPAWTQGAGRR
ncbi:MAG TPA: VOC family protein [Thermoplasmata archaeon]|nr:VOC family protein [Thermoplasmata archaeon]